MRFVLAMVAAAALAGGLAAAEETRLGAEAARAELYGVELIGVVEGGGPAWRECIEPGGRTFYEIEGERDEGRLAIDAEGLACFSYASSGYQERACFAVFRAGDGYRFKGLGPAFLTTAVRRGVASCPAAGGVGV